MTEKTCEQQYQAERIKQAAGSIKKSAVLCFIVFALRLLALYMTCAGDECYMSKVWLICMMVLLFAIILAYPIICKLIDNCSYEIGRFIHIAICLVLNIAQISIPIAQVVARVESEYDRVTALALFLSISLHLASNVCREKLLSSVCLLNCLITFYFFAYNRSLADPVSSLLKFAFSIAFCLLTLYSNEDDRKSNFFLQWTLQRREEMYRRFLEALPIKVVIFSSDEGDIKYQNNYRLEVIRRSVLNGTIDSADEFNELMNRITNYKGDSLLSDFHRLMASPETRNPVITGEYFLKEEDMTRIISATLLGSSVLCEKGTMGIILEDVTEKRSQEEERNVNKYANALMCSLSQ